MRDICSNPYLSHIKPTHLSEKMKTIPTRIQNKYSEIFSLQPNQLGNNRINLFYKITTRFLKKAPFIVIIPVTMLVVVLIYILIGPLLVKLASFLQYGF